MDYTIVEKPAFTVVGKGLRVSMKNGENTRVIPEFWMENSRNGFVPALAATSRKDGVTGDSTLGLCTDFAADMSEFTYIIAVEKGSSDAPAGGTELHVPALTYAVFKGSGPVPDSIPSVWGSIMGEFFPAGQYAHGPGPDIEVYPPGDPFAASYSLEIWVPVVKK